MYNYERRNCSHGYMCNIRTIRTDSRRRPTCRHHARSIPHFHCLALTLCCNACIKLPYSACFLFLSFLNRTDPTSSSVLHASSTPPPPLFIPESRNLPAACCSFASFAHIICTNVAGWSGPLIACRSSLGRHMQREQANITMTDTAASDLTRATTASHAA